MKKAFFTRKIPTKWEPWNFILKYSPMKISAWRSKCFTTPTSGQKWRTEIATIAVIDITAIRSKQHTEGLVEVADVNVFVEVFVAFCSISSAVLVCPSTHVVLLVVGISWGQLSVVSSKLFMASTRENSWCCDVYCINLLFTIISKSVFWITVALGLWLINNIWFWVRDPHIRVIKTLDILFNYQLRHSWNLDCCKKSISQ